MLSFLQREILKHSTLFLSRQDTIFFLKRIKRIAAHISVKKIDIAMNPKPHFLIEYNYICLLPNYTFVYSIKLIDILISVHFISKGTTNICICIQILHKGHPLLLLSIILCLHLQFADMLKYWPNVLHFTKTDLL